MKKLFTIANCIIVALSFLVGGGLAAYEDRFGILTVAEPQELGTLPELNENKDTDGKININTATSKELERLNGIGEKLAERIITYRENEESFKQPEDIMKVPGIGKELFERVKNEICAY